MNDPRSFGSWLTRERERRAITVRAIADRTKIGVGLLEALERGDVSRWPGGIYRRAFVRAYADVVGLDADLVVANFERVFPDPEAPVPIEAPTPAPVTFSDDEGGMRLQLAGLPTPVAAWSAALREVGFAVAFGVLGFVAAGALGFWCATAVAAIVHRVCSLIGKDRPRPATAPREPAVAPRPLATVVQFDEATWGVDALRARASAVAALTSSSGPETSNLSLH
jgi:transcriptional regulator with XRE-family HTH domain